MAKTLLDLAKNLERYSKELPKKASALSVMVATTLVEELTEITPVDTSNAISNWQVRIGAPVTTERAPYYSGHKGSTAGMSEDATVIAAKITLKRKKPGQLLYISNNAPYIQDLNDGSSKQAPPGFVEGAVENARDLIRYTKTGLTYVN